MQDDEKALFDYDECMKIYRAHPQFFRALELEDKSELYK